MSSLLQIKSKFKAAVVARNERGVVAVLHQRTQTCRTLM